MRWPLYIFITLTLLFLAFSASLYVRAENHASREGKMDGKLVWQKYNCQSCHQLYGLGGYLGPDLTNIMSEHGKGREYIVGIISSGARQMPAFILTEDEQAALLDFLRQADSSGNADPRAFRVTASGMIHSR